MAVCAVIPERVVKSWSEKGREEAYVESQRRDVNEWSPISGWNCFKRPIRRKKSFLVRQILVGTSL